MTNITLIEIILVSSIVFVTLTGLLLAGLYLYVRSIVLKLASLGYFEAGWSVSKLCFFLIRAAEWREFLDLNLDENGRWKQWLEDRN